ncbi:MAG: glycoside hydrolase family 20 zincin-like fold domain-containing protein [Verrucomicrobiae bacterium]
MMTDLILLPPPRRLVAFKGTSSGTRPRVRIADIGRSEADAYRLTITPDGVTIEAPHPSGLYYGKQTLAQIRRQRSGPLPCLQILDWPDYPVRGFYHDVSRGKVPKLKTLLALADKCAHYKINQLQLYVEHTFAFQNHPEVWQGADPLTADEILALDEHCASRHIELVPSLSTFGHFYGFLHTKKLQHLNELERDVSGEPFNWWDRQAHYTLDCRNPESIALVREIIAEVRPLFRSKIFNICADETFDLGKGKNRRRAAKLGAGRLYVDFLKQIMAAVREAGSTPMFWGDVIGHHPELVGEIPSDAIALDWDYDADLKNSRSELLKNAGCRYYVCPGVAGWGRAINDYRTAHQNITRFAKLGRRRGAAGLLNTDWGDYGHINALGLSFPGLILGAAAAWNPLSPALRESRMEPAVSRYELGDPTGRLLGLLREASAAGRLASWQALSFWQQPRSKDMPDSWFDAESGLPDMIFKHPYQKHAAALRMIKHLTKKIESLLAKSAPQDPLVASEILTGLFALRVFEEIFLVLHGRRKKQRPAPPKAERVAADVRALETRMRRDWLKRNKPSEFARVGDVLLGIAEAL